jgi:hypothetical protein
MDITSDRIRGMNGFLSKIDDILISMNPTLKARDLVFEEDLKDLSDQIHDETVTAQPPKERPDPLGPNERYVEFKNMTYRLGPVDNGVAKIYGKHGLAGLVIDPELLKPNIFSKTDAPDGFSPEIFGDYLITLTATDRNELQREQKRANELINQIVSNPDSADEAVSELKQLNPVVFKLISQAISNLVSQGGGIIEPEEKQEPEQKKSTTTPIMTPDTKSTAEKSVNAAIAAIRRRHE